MDEAKAKLKHIFPDPRKPKGSFVMICCGRRGSGKTTLLKRLLITAAAFKGKFDEIILISKTAHVSGDWSQLDTSNWSIYTEFDQVIIKELIEKQSQNPIFRFGQPRSKVLVIMDDLGMKTRKVKASETDYLDDLACNGRHLDISCIFLGQVFTQFPTSFRSNANITISYAMNNFRDMLALYGEVGGCGCYKSFRDQVHTVTAKQYDFLTIRNRGGRLTFFKNFTQIELKY
jgi:hypothetical protein